MAPSTAPAAIMLTGIARLRCHNCHTRMTPTAIAPGPTGFEHRTFDCPHCGHIEKIVIASDPLKAGGIGWLVGELKPPG
jgi:hypothetical protein